MRISIVPILRKDKVRKDGNDAKIDAFCISKKCEKYPFSRTIFLLPFPDYFAETDTILQSL